jgi:hypothetical protein
MDLSALLALFSNMGPVGILIGAALTVLLQRMNIKLPSLPLPSPKPAPEPTPAPSPDAPILPNFPVLDSLLKLLLLLKSKQLSKEEAVIAEMLVKELSPKVESK